MKNKKAQSEVITTVLLIMLALVLIAVVFAFVIPFVKNTLQKNQGCYELLGKVSIDNSMGLTCYSTSTKKLNVGIHFGEVGDNAKGVAIEVLLDDGSSKSYKIEQGSTLDGVAMYSASGAGSTILALPGDNEERTYTFDLTGLGKPGIVNAYAIAKSGKVCEEKTTINIQSCGY